LFAVVVSTSTFALVAGLGVWSVLYRLSTKAKREHDTVHEPQLALQEDTRNVQ
jgi:hypothetical protein